MNATHTTAMHDPDAIFAAWQAIAQSGEHIHQPQVAARLGVPEACLTASRCGEAATRLAGDAAAILRDATSLGKVLIAVPHHAGVAIAIAKNLQCEQHEGWLTLTSGSENAGEYVHFRLRLEAVDSLYTLIDPDGPHGRERHLQLFDTQGNGICKLLVLYKSQESGLKALAKRWQAADQGRQWQPTGSPLQTALTDTPPLGRALEQPPGEWLAARHAQQAPLRFCFQRPSTALEVICTPKRLHTDERNVLHVQHPCFKLHARLNAWSETLAWDNGVASLGRDSWIGCQAFSGRHSPERVQQKAQEHSQDEGVGK